MPLLRLSAVFFATELKKDYGVFSNCFDYERVKFFCFLPMYFVKPWKGGMAASMSLGERADTFSHSGDQASPGAGAVPGRSSIDRLEFNRQWEQQEEEEQIEAALALYAKAARQRMQLEPPEPPEPMDEEELQALSQELKLRQKCQDIAAQIMVDELEDVFDGEDGD